MNTCFEFHDSVLAVIKREAGRCVLRFRPAYVHRSAGRPGIDPGDGLHQEIEIEIAGVKAMPPPVALPVKLSGGAMTVGEARFQNCAPLPLRQAEKTVLTIGPATASGAFQIEGDSVEIRAIGEAGFVERFPGVSR